MSQPRTSTRQLAVLLIALVVGFYCGRFFGRAEAPRIAYHYINPPAYLWSSDPLTPAIIADRHGWYGGEGPDYRRIETNRRSKLRSECSST